MEIPAGFESSINKIELLEEKKGWHNKKLLAAVGAGLILLVIIPGLIFLVKNGQKQETASADSTEQESQTISKQYPINYYVTTSQQFLARAQGLSAQEQQSQTEKEEIITEIKKALQIIDEGIRVYPQDDRVYAQRASIYQALIPTLSDAKKYALNDFKTAASLNPQNPEYQQKMGELYKSLGDLSNSASCFYNAYNLKPNDQQTLFLLADSLERSGQLEKAVYYFDKLITLLPDSDENKTLLADRKSRLKKMVLAVKSESLTDPSLIIPDKPQSQENFILGSQDLPIEQAAGTTQLIIAQDQEAISSTDAKTDQNAKSGQVILPAGQKEITVESIHIGLNSKIIVQPNDENININLNVRAKKAAENGQTGWFRVEADSIPQKDLGFTWWIID